MIHADTSGELARHTRHKLKYRRRPKRKPFPIADRTSIYSRPEQADGKRFGDFETDLIVDSQPLHTHDRGASHKHALHDQTCPWEEGRALD